MSERQLFRQEAVAFQLQAQSGKVVMLQPLPVTLLVWSIAAAFALIAAFLALADYARKETVIGHLTPAAGVARILVPRAGTVTAVHVRDGEEVKEGEPLLTVRIDQIAADGTNVDAQLLETLARQKTALIEQIEMQEARALSEQGRVEAQIAGATGQITHLEEQIALQRQRSDLAQSVVQSLDELRAKGYVTEVEYKRRQEAHLDARVNLGALDQQLALRRAELAQAHAALEQLPAGISEKVQALKSQLAEAEQRMAEIEGRRAFVVRAPIAGRVSTLQAVVGGAVDPRQVQLSLLPRESLLQAELYVPAQAIGFVRSGQPVRILYDAFPYQRFGAHGGRIERVTHTMLTDADVAGPVKLHEPAYKVTVRLDRQDVTAYGEHIPLQPDMLLKADIILDRRPLLSWLLDPILSARVS